MADSFYSDLSKLKFQSLVYPNDLNTDNFYPDCVCFTIQKRTGVSITDMTDSVGAGAKKFNEGFKGKVGKDGKVPPSLKKAIHDALDGKDLPTEAARQTAESAAIAEWKKTEIGQETDLPENMFDVIDLSLGAFSSSMVGRQQKALQMQKEGKNILGSMYLNMPNGIQFNEAANWGGQELGFMGKMSKDLVSGGGQDAGTTATGALVGSGGSLIGGAIGALPSLVSKLGISGGMFGAAIGAMAAGSPMQKGAEAALGVAQNPYMEMMFSGVGFRKFQFEFILRPKSETEFNTVAEILNKFRTFTKPTFTEGKLGKSFMDYPMEFKIEFLTSGEKADQGATARRGGMDFVVNPHIPRLKNCVCDNVTSNFTPQSIWAAHEEGAPVAVTLSLSFQETELVMAEDVYNGEY
jgi:hypothetical protein